MPAQTLLDTLRIRILINLNSFLDIPNSTKVLESTFILTS
jgi:hypothetical protein